LLAATARNLVSLAHVQMIGHRLESMPGLRCARAEQLGVGSSDRVRVPTVGNGSGNWHCQLGPGNDSVAVSRLQIALVSWCNLSAGLTVDGDYGPLTQQAVKNVQHAYGITVDGIYGPQTAAAIMWPTAGGNGTACTLIG
jgi:murein L,D-transpeptidase YcbB/YkuD